MPSAVWWEWWPTPTVPVPMARRLVWMPVLPRVTVSAAVNLRESAEIAKARRANAEEWSQAAPAAQAVRWRNSRRFMGPAAVTVGADCLLYRRASKAFGYQWRRGMGRNWPSGKGARREAASLLANLPMSRYICRTARRRDANRE